MLKIKNTPVCQEQIRSIHSTDSELLNYAIENGMIDIGTIRAQLEMSERKKYLEMHEYNIWQSENGYFYTYMPDEEKGRIQRRKKSRKDLEDFIINYYKDIEMRPCFRTAYTQWIAEKEQYEEIGRNSITRYNTDFERFFPPDNPFCKIRLCEMTDSELERFIKQTIKDKHLTQKAYAGLRLLLIGVFKFAKREGYTTYSISTFFKDLSLPQNIFKKKIKDKEHEVFNEKEVTLLMKYFNENPTLENRGLMLAFLTGTRVGELSTLKFDDNMKRNVLKIRRTEITYHDKTLNKRVTTVKEFPKTDSGIRDILLPEKAQIVLDSIKIISHGEEYLFTKNGKRVTARMFEFYLKKACLAVDIKPRSMHKIRKTYASKLLASNMDEAIVLNQMGHSNIITTQNYYHYNITDDDTQFKKINQALNF